MKSKPRREEGGTNSDHRAKRGGEAPSGFMLEKIFNFRLCRISHEPGAHAYGMKILGGLRAVDPCSLFGAVEQDTICDRHFIAAPRLSSSWERSAGLDPPTARFQK